MLTITPCIEKQTLLTYCKKCRKPVSAGHYAYLAQNRDEVLAACLFEIQSDYVEALFYEASDSLDAFLFDGVLRAGLNYASKQGISQGIIPETFRFSQRHLLEKLNYPLDTTFNIVNFFRKYKNCANV